MNKKAFIFIIAAVFAVSGLVSCRSTQKAVDYHNARTSLDWSGVYTGTIPSASGPGIDIRLKLNSDQSYELRYIYLINPNDQFNWNGGFIWDDAGNIITLGIAEAPCYYMVAENRLIQLDMNKKVITGALADQYVLKKVL